MKDLKVFKVESENNSAGSITLLHGYGANGKDLIGIATFPEFKDLNFDWYFLEAPLSPPELAAFGGRAWFNLSMQNFMNNMSSNNFEDFYKLESNEFTQSFESIKQSLWNLELESDKKHFIGGFSQGAMMAAHIFFENMPAWSGAVLMSGAPFQHMNWNKNSSPSKPIFQSHGYNDPVLPVKCGEDLTKYLKANNSDVTSSWFNGGHEIPLKALMDMKAFLQKLL